MRLRRRAPAFEPPDLKENCGSRSRARPHRESRNSVSSRSPLRCSRRRRGRRLGMCSASLGYRTTFYRWGPLRRSDAVGGAQADAPRGRECPAATAGIGSEPGQEDAPGGLAKKSLRPAQERELVDHVRTVFRIGTRRACRMLDLHRLMYLYRSRRPEQALLRKRIREIAETHVRCGYRRIHILLNREGWSAGRTWVYRLYRLEGLQMRHHPPRRRVMAKLRDDRMAAVAPNDCWSMDWMYDQLFDGTRLWVLTLVDNFSRVCPALWAGQQAKTSDTESGIRNISRMRQLRSTRGSKRCNAVSEIGSCFLKEFSSRRQSNVERGSSSELSH